jgi:hypothetical protein
VGEGGGGEGGEEVKHLLLQPWISLKLKLWRKKETNQILIPKMIFLNFSSALIAVEQTV